MSEPTVNITKREKIYPEEDYDFEGTVNGKAWEAHQTLGMGASIMLDSDEDLTEDEKEAIFDTIWHY